MSRLKGLALTDGAVVGGGRSAVVRAYQPIQYLRLQEASGTKAYDASGKGRHGTYTAADAAAMVGQQAGPVGGRVPAFAAANTSWIDAYSAGLGAAASGAEGAAFVMVKANPAMWSDGAQHWFWIMRASATYYLALQKWSTNDQIRLRRFTNSTDLSVSFSYSSPLWFALGMDWSEAAGVVRLYVNGSQVGADGAITVAWSGAINLARVGRDVGSGTLYHSGGLAELAVFAQPLGAAGHLALAGDLARRNVFLAYGDSKTAANVYQHTACAALEAASQEVTSGAKWDWRNIAHSGYTVATMKAEVDADLAGYSGPAPKCVLANLGANDVAALPGEAVWKADYQDIFDAIHAKWPDTKIYIMRVWRRGEAADCDTLAGWIGDLVAANPGLCYLGPDERVFLENGDDGVTYTSDGIHPTTAGYALVGQQWASVLPG